MSNATPDVLHIRVCSLVKATILPKNAIDVKVSVEIRIRSNNNNSIANYFWNISDMSNVTLNVITRNRKQYL